MKEFIISLFVDFPVELATFLIAIIPVTELRASIPLAVTVYEMSPFSAWLFSVLGTFFAMLLILFVLDPVQKWLSHHIYFFNRFFAWVFEHTRNKANKKMEKYGDWAIFILAATPIPLVGGLTGALAAFIFGVPYKKAIPLLLLGTMIAGGIVLFLTLRVV